MLYSPSACVLQDSVFGRLDLGWMFLLNFWGEGLVALILRCLWPRWDCTEPLPGGQAKSCAQDCSRWLLFPEGSLHSFRGWTCKWWPPSLQPWSQELMSPLFSAPSGKSIHSLLSPRSLSTLRVHPDCDCFYLRHMTPVLSLQTTQTPWRSHTCYSSWGREGHLTGSATCWAPAWRLGMHSVQGSWFMATLSCRPAPGLADCAQFPPHLCPGTPSH